MIIHKNKNYMLLELTEDGTWSTCLAPWFDTNIPETPADTPKSASSAVKIPLRTNGRSVILKGGY